MGMGFADADFIQKEGSGSLASGILVWSFSDEYL